MKYLFIKNKNILYSIIKYELLRIKYKFIFFNTVLPYFLRQKAFFLLNELPKNSSLVKLRNRCFWSNRSVFILKQFNLSRFSLKKKVTLSLITGLKKSSW